MSFGSGYEKRRDERTTVRIATWSNLGVTDVSNRAHCLTCTGVRLTISETPNGKVGNCRECNTNYPLDKVPNTETGIGTTLIPRYTSKYGSTAKTNSMLISQGNKKKTKEQLEKEQVGKELGTDGITIIDSRESTYQDGS